MEIDIQEALKRPDVQFIDVRSPGEYVEASIPGAVNIPLFEDREHYQLSIIYYQLGEHEARRAALEVVAPKLPFLVNKITAACGEKTPLLYCKRGGMRSLSLYQVLSLTGIKTLRLKNGYKDYRRYVNNRLSSYNLNNELYVLHGLTGVGKTLVLKELERRDVPTLDLEGLARHRGSVFGAVGFDKPRSQKDFDTHLLQHLDRHSNNPYLVVEGEGRRIGNIYLPRFLTEAMKNGNHFLLTTSLETRVKRIVDTYVQVPLDEIVFEQLKNALYSLRRRLGSQKTDRLISMLEKGDHHAVARILCTDYYDQFYNDSRPECSQFSETIDATDIDQAADQIINKINCTYSVSAHSALQQ